MELQEVLSKIKDFESLNDPREIDLLLFEVSSHKADLEEALHQQDYKVSVKRLALIREFGKVNQAEAQLEIEDVYTEQKKLEYQLKILGEFKTNLRRRYDLLTNKFL